MQVHEAQKLARRTIACKKPTKIKGRPTQSGGLCRWILPA